MIVSVPLRILRNSDLILGKGIRNDESFAGITILGIYRNFEEQKGSKKMGDDWNTDTDMVC